MLFRCMAALVVLAAAAPTCVAFSTNPTPLAIKSSPQKMSKSSSLYMGPPTDPSAPATDLYGEGSRKYRRTVYTHDQWVKHRSPDRFVNNLSTLFNSGIYKNVGKEVFATTSVAVFVWAWNMLVGGYQDLAGVAHDPIIQGEWAKVVGLPLQPFTVVNSSLGLLLGKIALFIIAIVFMIAIESFSRYLKILLSRCSIPHQLFL